MTKSELRKYAKDNGLTVAEAKVAMRKLAASKKNSNKPVIVSDLYSLKYNKSEAEAINAWDNIMQTPWLQLSLIIPESMLHLVPVMFEIEDCGQVYLEQGLPEKAYLVTAEEADFSFVRGQIRANEFKQRPNYGNLSNLDIAIQFGQSQARVLPKGGRWIAPQAFGPLNPMERSIAIAEWKKVFTTVKVNGEMVTCTV
jgi:hypothetical protein